MEACWLLTLRAVAQSARLVQQSAALSAAESGGSPKLQLEQPPMGRECGGDLSAVKVWSRLLNTDSYVSYQHLLTLKPKTRKHLSVGVVFLAINKSNSIGGVTTLPREGRKGCWLTIRSTGPIAACRHLGYKSLAQMPARRNGPVSSNVRRRILNTVDANVFCTCTVLPSSTYLESVKCLISMAGGSCSRFFYSFWPPQSGE